MESSYTSHIKASHLKSLIQGEGNCEQKLEKISDLVGLPFSSNTENTDNTEIKSVVADDVERERLEKREECFKRILEGLTGKSEKLARGLLQRIESAENISFDYTTLEISINGVKKSNSSIRSLVHRMITSSSPQLPICLAEFINGLIENRTPLNYYVNSDCLNLRLSLISLKRSKQLSDNPEGNGGDSVGNESEVPPAETVQNEVSNVSNPDASLAPTESKPILKRRREEEEEGEEEEGSSGSRKKAKVSEETAPNFDGKVNRKRAREVEEEEEVEEKSSKKAKKGAEKKVKFQREGTRKSKRVQLKSDIAKDWVS